MELEPERRDAVLLAMVATSLSGCITVTNKYSLFEFNKPGDDSTAANGSWPLVVVVLLSFLAIGILLTCFYLVRRWLQSRVSKPADSQTPVSNGPTTEQPG